MIRLCSFAELWSKNKLIIRTWRVDLLSFFQCMIAWLSTYFLSLIVRCLTFFPRDGWLVSVPTQAPKVPLKRVVQGFSLDARLADFFFMKREFRKLFFMFRDMRVLRNSWRTWIIHRFHYSFLRDFETSDLQMVGVVYREWFRLAKCNMGPWLCLSRFFFLQTLV